MSNLYITPNRAIIHSGDIMVSSWFGNVRSVDAVRFPGPGHHPIVRVRHEAGFLVDYAPATLVELCRRAPEALLALDAGLDVHDAAGGVE